MRRYTGGVALVDPSPSVSQSFQLGGTYLTPSGASVTSVTLAPTTGMILHSPGGVPTTTQATTTATTSSTTTTSTTTTTPATTTTEATTTTASNGPQGKGKGFNHNHP